MKVVILAGGFGTRLSEETDVKPKPMVEIGGKPMLWHIMNIYSANGYNDFIICCGYKGYVIKDYFINYYKHMCDVTVDLANGLLNIHNNKSEKWKVTLIDTGLNTLTGGRIKRIKDYVGNEPFLLTYGDGVGNVDIKETVKYHNLKKGLVTVTAVKPVGRFGALNIDENDKVTSFREKPEGDKNWINGGFFVCEPGIFEYIKGDETIWERGPMEKIAEEGKLNTYKHHGFWMPMDTLREKRELEKLWNSGEAPWKVW